MKRTLRTTTLLFFVAACVLFVFCGLYSATNTTYALLPESYSTAVGEDGDWYFADSFLNISALKTTVSSWFNDARVYDFSDLERQPIVIAVIDSGINAQHELFAGFYDSEGKPINEKEGVGEYDVLYRDSDGNLICANTVNEEITFNCVDDSNDKHGTHVAGIIATLIHELNLEKYIKIMPIKASYVDKDKKSHFSTKALERAVNFAVENGAKVLNMSLSSLEGADSYGTPMTDGIASKAVLVAAAGNDGTASETGKNGQYKHYHYPAASKNVIGVMNLTHSGKKYLLHESSNFGNAYDLAAPGIGIWSADGETQDGYKQLKGTSMSTPFVSFGAALAMVKYSAIAKATGSINAKTPEQIASIIRASFKSSFVHNSRTIKVFDINTFASDEGTYSVYIDSGDSELNQTIGDVKEVYLTAELLPLNEDNEELSKNIKWYLMGDDGEREELGTGRNLTFIPPNAVGTYEIAAEYTAENSLNASKTITVSYVEPSQEETKIDVDDSDETNIDYKAGDTYTFSIDNYQNYDSATIVIWYVNGEYAGNGFSFEFTPTEPGEYNISVKINGIVINDVIAVNIPEPLVGKDILSAYVSIVVALGIAAIMMICALVYILKFKHKSN